LNWNEKNVLVTGAGGFIGSHLVEKLVELGANVSAMVHYNAIGKWGWLDSSPVCNKINIISGDICDRDSIRNAMKGADVVFHLAALIAIPYSYNSPASYVRTNIEGTLNLLQSAREYDIERIVHTSTSEVYGTARYVPIDEEHPLQGQSPYSATKIAADKLAESFHLSFGLPVATIRPFNTFGPRQSARAVIPTIITQVLSHLPIHLGSLNPTRDFNYVDNTVEGFIKVAESDKAIGQVTNIGSGKDISIGKLAELIMHLIGDEVPIICDKDRIRPVNSEVGRLCADNRKAHELHGWHPRYTLEEGLKYTIDWMVGNIESYRPNAYAI
jgi:dTDP-glucose 4,6-dehydratase